MAEIGFRSLLLAFFCAGCQLGPPYKIPEAAIPENWKAETANIETDSNDTEVEETCLMNYWWDVFRDDQLSQLEMQALNFNRDLFQAVERVVEARALAGVQLADLYPQINLNPSYSDSGMLFQFFLPPGLATTVAPNGITPFRVHQYQFVLPLNLSYELDLWGKLKGQYRSAFYNAEAKAEGLCAALLSVTTDLANSYFLLRSYDEQISLQQDLLQELKSANQIANSRYEKGIANKLEVSQSSIQLLGVESQLLNSIRLRRLEENRIAILLGSPPSDFSIESQLLRNDPPQIPAGLPASIITQRPDIREAERIVASEQALIGVAYASYLPSLELTGTIGFLSPDFKQFLRWISRLWIMGVNINQTVFDGGRNDENVALSWSRFRQSSYAYQQKILVAFREVEDALVNLDLQEQQQKMIALQYQTAKEAAMLSKNRYGQGLVNYLEVTIAMQSYIDAELNYASIKGARYLSTIQLIKALGGAW